MVVPETLGDCQKVNCPKGKRNHPGVRQCAHWLAMTCSLFLPKNEK